MGEAGQGDACPVPPCVLQRWPAAMGSSRQRGSTWPRSILIPHPCAITALGSPGGAACILGALKESAKVPKSRTGHLG